MRRRLYRPNRDLEVPRIDARVAVHLIQDIPQTSYYLGWTPEQPPQHPGVFVEVGAPKDLLQKVLLVGRKTG